MKTFVVKFLVMIVGVALWPSCKDTTGGVAGTITGGAYELLVIMDKESWNGTLGDTIKEWFRQPLAGLPQPEPMFTVINMPQEYFKARTRAFRSILFVNISNKIKKPAIVYRDSPWAKTQKYIQVDAPDKQSFIAIFNQHKQEMTQTYVTSERQRMIQAYKNRLSHRADSLLKTKYNLTLRVPHGYNVNKDSADFVWISRETRVDSRGLAIFQEEYTSEEQFKQEDILKKVNQKLNENIPGPLAGSYMRVDMVTPVTSEYYQYNDKYYAVLIRGLWSVENDFMGGPFVLNVVLDEKNNRVVYEMAYVYAPDSRKRNLVRETESILFTLEM